MKNLALLLSGAFTASLIATSVVADPATPGPRPGTVEAMRCLVRQEQCREKYGKHARRTHHDLDADAAPQDPGHLQCIVDEVVERVEPRGGMDSMRPCLREREAASRDGEHPPCQQRYRHA